MDFKDNTISLILFGRENQFKKQKKFGLIEAEDDNSTFLQNVTLNSFYFEKKKKIIYYIILMIIDPEKDLIKNTVTLILSLNEQEVPFLLYCLLSNYKILYQDVSFINEKSFDSFMNDIHIYDVSNELSSHFCSFFAKVNKESSNKSLICLLKNKESFDAFLIKKLGKQIKSICELKKHWFYEIGGYVISSLVLKYFSLNRKNNNSLLLESILELKKIVKKNHILNIAINLNLFEIIEKI